MSKVYIAQLKCPLDHCLIAMASEYENDRQAGTLAEPLLRLEVERLVNEQTLRPACAICGSTQLRVTVGATRFATLDEAAPYLAESQAQQLWTQRVLRGTKN